MYACPHLLSGQFIVFPDADSVLPEAICHDRAHAQKIVDGAKSTGGEVALVLDRLVATFWR